MKMNQNGISTIAIVAIVVTVVVVAVVGIAAAVVLLGGAGGGPGGLSIHSGSQSWEIPENIKANISAGVEVKGYTVSGVSVQDIIDWYKGQMTGWKLEYEAPVTSVGGITMHVLLYSKGNDGAAIVAMSGTGLPDTCYILATGSLSAFGITPTTTPTTTTTTTHTTTTTPTTTTTTTPTTTTTTTGGGIGSATSLQFVVDVTAGGTASTMTFKAKDIGSSSMKVRVEGTAADQEFTYIINGANQTLWIYVTGQWVDMSGNFSTYWDTWAGAFEGYQTSLSEWTGGTYTSPDGTVTVHDIIVNPVLADSLFVH